MGRCPIFSSHEIQQVGVMCETSHVPGEIHSLVAAVSHNEHLGSCSPP